MVLDTMELSSILDNLTDDKWVEQYIELGELAQQLIPLFTIMQNDLANDEDYYVKIANAVLEYYGESIRINKPTETHVFNMNIGADFDIVRFYALTDLQVKREKGILKELTAGCELTLTLVMAYFHKYVGDLNDLATPHTTIIEHIAKGVIKELYLHKFLITEDSDDEKLEIFTKWMYTKVISLLNIMYNFVNATFKDVFIPLFAIHGSDSEEEIEINKYGVLIFHYKK